jgi:hypothetical protein
VRLYRRLRVKGGREDGVVEEKEERGEREEREEGAI